MPESIESSQTTSATASIESEELKSGQAVNIETQENPEDARVVEISEGKEAVALLRVYGQGPVKPLVIYNELPQEKREEWDAYVQDPLHNHEPNFRVLEGNEYLEKLGLSKEVLSENKDITMEQLIEKLGLNYTAINKELIELQRQGRFGLNRYGRQNALAAAKEILANPSRLPKRVLISGGYTLPPDAAKYLPRERIEAIPSEGDLIADIIKRQLRIKDFQPTAGYDSIDDYITVQKDSTNTLIEFANMMNEHPDWLEGKLVFIGADFHIDRIGKLAQLFIPDSNVDVRSAQKIIIEEMVRINKQREKNDIDRPDEEKVDQTNRYNQILNWMTNPKNKDYEQRLYEEIVWAQALEEPETLTYWLGFVGAVKRPDVLMRTINKLSSERYRKNAVEIFGKVGLDFENLMHVDFLEAKNKELFTEVRLKLSEYMKPENREMPSESKEFKKRLVPAKTLQE